MINPKEEGNLCTLWVVVVVELKSGHFTTRDDMGSNRHQQLLSNIYLLLIAFTKDKN